MLLCEVRGPRSFSDLKTVGGHVCATFQEACDRLGLLESDTHWADTMQDAVICRTPARLRELFVTILTFCNPQHPRELWEQFKEHLYEDFERNLQRLDLAPNVDLAMNQALLAIEDACFLINGKTLIQMGLPAPMRTSNDVLSTELLRERAYDMDELTAYIATNKPLLTDDQRQAFDAILRAIGREEGCIIFLDAPGGTGKTFLLNLILAEVRTRKEMAIALASSGIAATLLDGGRTAHSILKIPLNIGNLEHPTLRISKTSGIGMLLKACRVIIWDECTMAHKNSLEALDRTLRDLKNDALVMGGTIILLAGDFRQTLPIVKDGMAADELDACLKSSRLWRIVKSFPLRTNMRARNNSDPNSAAFASLLLQIGNGTYPTIPGSTHISIQPTLGQVVSTIDNLVSQVFPDISCKYKDLRWLSKRAILAPRNEDFDAINSKILALLPGRIHEYKSYDSVMDKNDAASYTTEFLNSLNLSGTPQHILKLKCGAPVILIRNVRPPKLCNGTRLSVTRMQRNLIEAKILVGKYAGEDVYIPRVPIIPDNFPIQFKRVQFPIRLAFAMSINKAQGQSLDIAGLNLEKDCFSHGQLYVACSRVGSSKDLFIYAPGKSTRNIVYPRALQ